HDDGFGVCAARDQPHDAVALAPRGSAPTQRGHAPGELQARNVGHTSGRCRIPAAALERVGAVDARRLYSYEDLPRTRYRIGDFADLENVGTARLTDYDGTHSRIRTGGCPGARPKGSPGT